MTTRPFLVLVFVFAVFATRADQVDTYINEQMQRAPIPGVVLTVLRDGKEVKTGAYGVANLELDVPVTRESVFELGALSSQFTAAAIVLLNEAGKVSYDLPISTYIPGAPKAWKDVTVRHCLSHTSGLKNYTFLDGFELRQHLTQQKFLQLIGEYPLDFEPGTKAAYSQTDSTLLGYIINNVSGQDYWSYLQQKFFRPLNMTATYVRNPIHIIPNRATGYVKAKGGGYEHRDYDLTDMFAAGDIATTIGDMAKWDNAMNDTTIFSETSRKLFWTGGTLDNGGAHNMGFIFRIGKMKGYTEFTQVGSTGGFSSAHMRYPDAKLSIIVMANHNDMNLAANLVRGIANFYLQ